jgi:uncharacterized protein YfdQ (DUF2303 family)
MNKEELNAIFKEIDELNEMTCKSFIKGFITSLDIFSQMEKQDQSSVISKMEARIKELEEERQNMVRKRPMINYSSLYDVKRPSATKNKES